MRSASLYKLLHAQLPQLSIDSREGDSLKTSFRRSQSVDHSCRFRSRKSTPFNSAPSSAVNDVMYSQTSVAMPAPNDP